MTLKKNLWLTALLATGALGWWTLQQKKQPTVTSPPATPKTAPALPAKLATPTTQAAAPMNLPPAPPAAQPNNPPDYATFATMTLWEDLLAGLQKGDYQQIALENALIARLREESGDEVYRHLLAVFRAGKLSVDAQRLLISLLGEVTNYAAGETLIQLLQEKLLRSADVKLTALHAIEKFTPESWYEHANAELAPVFEKVWTKIDEPNFLAAIARVMAKIGTPQSLALFEQTLTNSKNPSRLSAVKQAMANFENPALIARFSENLQSPVKNLQWASGYALANMGQDAATAELFNWASHADATQASLVKEWFDIAVTTTPSFADWLKTHLATQAFHSAEMKQTVAQVMIDSGNN